MMLTCDLTFHGKLWLDVRGSSLPEIVAGPVVALRDRLSVWSSLPEIVARPGRHFQGWGCLHQMRQNLARRYVSSIGKVSVVYMERIQLDMWKV